MHEKKAEEYNSRKDEKTKIGRVGINKRRYRCDSMPMQGDEARELLGFLPNSRPSASQVKAAYKRKAWEFHPDRFPAQEKYRAESNFKLISEAYSFLQDGSGREGSPRVYSRVVRTGVPRVHGGGSSHAMVKAPFLLLILGTLMLGGLNASRAYQRQKDAYPSHNPFLP